MQIEYKDNYEIRNHTSFKIGGEVERVYFPKNKEELVFLLTELDDYVLLGNCSNILFSSNGYKGNLILTTQMKNWKIEGTQVTADCGVKGPLLSKKVCEASLSGFEFMIGFPGSIGGEIYMNASCHGQAISDKLIRCSLFDKDTKTVIYKEKQEMEFEYRKSILQGGKYILLDAEFVLEKDNQADIEARINKNLSFRKDKQPNLVIPNAGSVFKNPENNSAGRLLDSIGAKNFEINGAKVWEKHANFVVNNNNATSEDVLELMVKMFTAVKNNYKIELAPEIIFIGDKTEKEENLCKILYQKMQK
ncbi:UDP-N-acetylmuramate dehydrogenase [bacterium]|nr:UDP-N-acetylmuramate dehydrogenase [bacterium]